MSLNEQQLSRKVQQILKLLQDDYIDDGIDILSAAEVTVLTQAILSGVINVEQVEALLHELSKKVKKIVKEYKSDELLTITRTRKPDLKGNN